MAIENTASNDFLSFVNSINAFDCCLPVMEKQNEVSIVYCTS